MTDAELLLLFQTLYPDNNEREISEEDLRDGLSALLTSLSQRLGDLNDLTTPVAYSLVSAINSLQTQISNLDIIAVQYGADDPNVTPPANFDVGTMYLQQQNVGGLIEGIALYIYTGIDTVGWAKLADKDGFLSGIQRVNKLAGSVFDLPALKKNQSIAYNFTALGLPDGDFQPSGWLGGTSGIQISQDTWVIALVDSPGGSWFDHGNKYLITNNKAENPAILPYPTLDDFPDPGTINKIYLALDTGLMYYWDQGIEDYQILGNAVEGTYINPTTFEDTNGDPVVPSANQIYIDTTTNKVYRWDGVKFVLITGGESGGSSIDLSHLTENNVPRYDPLTGNLENSAVFSRAGKVGIGMAEPTEALEVNGRTKANGVQLNNFTTTPLPNQITRNGDKLKYTNSSGVTRDVMVGFTTENDEIEFTGDGTPANPLQASVANKIPYKAIDTDVTEPDLAQLNAHGTDRVDFPNLNRIYFLNGAKWTYVETIDLV